MNRQHVGAALFLFSGAVFLFIGLRSEPRQTIWVIFGLIFVVLGLTRLGGGRLR